MAPNKLVLLFIVFIGYFSRTLADVDCKSQPNFSMSTTCCRVMQPNMTKYNILQFPGCEKYSKNPGRNTFACISSCVLNSTGAIDQDAKLVIPNLRTTLTRFFTVDEKSLDNIVLPIFKECEAEAEKDKTNVQNASKRNRTESECSTSPLKYFMCAGNKILMNCPAEYWTTSQECQSIKEYVSKCAVLINDGVARRGGRRSRF